MFVIFKQENGEEPVAVCVCPNEDEAARVEEFLQAEYPDDTVYWEQLPAIEQGEFLMKEKVYTYTIRKSEFYAKEVAAESDLRPSFADNSIVGWASKSLITGNIIIYFESSEPEEPEAFAEEWYDYLLKRDTPFDDNCITCLPKDYDE